jgi:hypothetical protein
LKTLEPYEGKLSSTVPRGERRSNPPYLPNKRRGLDILLWVKEVQKFKMVTIYPLSLGEKDMIQIHFTKEQEM